MANPGIDDQGLRARLSLYAQLWSRTLIASLASLEQCSSRLPIASPFSRHWRPMSRPPGPTINLDAAIRLRQNMGTMTQIQHISRESCANIAPPSALARKRLLVPSFRSTPAVFPSRPIGESRPPHPGKEKMRFNNNLCAIRQSRWPTLFQWKSLRQSFICCI